MRAPDLATLDLYCDRVASAVGRLSVRVFGLGEEDGILLAHHLGRALQLTISCATSTRTPRSAGFICHSNIRCMRGSPAMTRKRLHAIRSCQKPVRRWRRARG